jgi:cell division protein FtsB
LGLKERWATFKESRVVRLVKNKFFITGVAFLVWITFFDSNNLIEWSRVIFNIGKQEAQKEYYKESIRRTEEKLQELSSNRDSLEKFAREQYLFKEDDEDLFIVETKP